MLCRHVTTKKRVTQVKQCLLGIIVQGDRYWTARLANDSINAQQRNQWEVKQK